MREKLSILTDELPLAQSLQESLVRAGFDVQVLPAAPKYWHRTRRFMSSLLIVDLDSVASDPLGHCRRLRLLTSAQIMAIGKPLGEQAILDAFRTGINEYMAKPLSHAELIARVEALLRRRPNEGGFRISRIPICPDVTVDTDKHLLYNRGRRIKLTPTEYSLLECLLRHPGQVVSRATLLREAWGDEKNPSIESLNLYIYYLRRKIERDPRRPKFILTKWGVGYYLAGDSRIPLGASVGKAALAGSVSSPGD